MPVLLPARVIVSVKEAPPEQWKSVSSSMFRCRFRQRPYRLKVDPGASWAWIARLNNGRRIIGILAPIFGSDTDRELVGIERGRETIARISPFED